MPQEWSGLAALAAAVVLLVSRLLRSWRSLVVAQAAVLLAVAAALLLPRIPSPG